MDSGNVKVEGYWRMTEGDQSQLPYPEANDRPWEKQAEFLAALADKESQANNITFRGFSQCRICNIINGCSEFSLDHWRWPEGLKHYIEDHNVRPSAEFVAFILQR